SKAGDLLDIQKQITEEAEKWAATIGVDLPTKKGSGGSGGSYMQKEVAPEENYQVGMAAGGYVNRPQMVMVGEQEEYVVPKQGALVLKGDGGNEQQLRALERIVSILERIEVSDKQITINLNAEDVVELGLGKLLGKAYTG
ncbi:MAG: hypothetical protein KDJ97_36870, partial [Anaerolineae bacterium]|nr:hypothetical protein [Anaerolineae bacterium]